MLAGATAFPLLPVARSFAQSPVEEVGDPQSCDYWRYCAMSGTLCSSAVALILLALQAPKRPPLLGLVRVETLQTIAII